MKRSEINKALKELKERLHMCEKFPHEIGLFLGYPLGDVKGFIKHRGQNCKCTGCWKVYCDEREARRQFCRFEKCRSIYCRLYREGRALSRLTVAA